MVALQFKMDPYSGKTLFIFCNKRHTAIKALRWDGNGFLLATKSLANDMKFQWPITKGELRDINIRQLQWLLEVSLASARRFPISTALMSRIFLVCPSIAIIFPAIKAGVLDCHIRYIRLLFSSILHISLAVFFPCLKCWQASL